MHLLDRIDHWGRTAPDRLAHRSNDRTLTYGELMEKSNRLAGWLMNELGDSRLPVAVHGHKEPEMLIAFLGAVKSGRAYVPIDSSIPPQRVDQIIQGADAAVTLTPERVAGLVREEHPGQPRRVEGDDTFYILFTSGSTGEPKGVQITLANLIHFVDWMKGEQQFSEGAETFLNQAPFSFDLSVMDLYPSLTSGGTLFSITKEQVANLKQLYLALAASEVTTWVSTPSFAQMCCIE